MKKLNNIAEKHIILNMLVNENYEFLTVNESDDLLFDDALNSWILLNKNGTLKITVYKFIDDSFLAIINNIMINITRDNLKQITNFDF